MEAPGYRIEQSAEKGRILVAARAMRRGELLLEEEAVLAAPASELDMCLRCFKLLAEDDEDVVCKGCGFSFCSEECRAELEGLHEAECALLRKSFFRDWVEENPGAAWPVVRGLATKARRPEAWQRLWQGFPAAVQAPSELSGQLAAACWGVQELGDVKAEDVERILSVCSIYAHLCWRAPQDADEEVCADTVLGLFELAGVPEHSCRPNLFKSFRQRGKELTIQLRLLADVEEGTALSLSYTDLTEPTHLRQEKLKSKGFRCRCPRCRDTTELGSYLSALACPSCSSRLAPSCPDYDVGKGGIFSCARCPVRLNWQAVRAFEESLETKLRELEAAAVADYEAKGELATFRDSCRARLQPGHWVLLRCNLALATLHPLAMREEESCDAALLPACDEALAALASFGPEVDDSRARLLESKALALKGSAEEEALRARARALRCALYGEEAADVLF